MDEDHITYRRLDHFEFDPIASFPNTEDDLVTIANTAYQVSAQGYTLLYYSNIHKSHCWARVVPS